MASPKKEKELKRNHRITLRFTDVEYEVISENAKDAKLPLAEYTRLQALNKKVTVKYEIVADVPELKKLIAEFGKTGSNLNQIARHLNQGGPQSAEMLKSLRQCMAEIYTMKYEVVKMAGSFAADAQRVCKINCVNYHRLFDTPIFLSLKIFSTKLCIIGRNWQTIFLEVNDYVTGF